MFKIAFIVNFSDLIVPVNAQIASMRFSRQGEAQSFVDGLNWAWRLSGSRMTACVVDATKELN